MPSDAGAPTLPVAVQSQPLIAASHPTVPALSLPSSPKLRECDYDVRPTDVYQAIEAKQWEFILKKFEGADDMDIPNPSTNSKNNLSPSQQACTWVVRKEQNGKLRWRLLPIHAAIIFQAPHEVVEILLDVYPDGAKAKDDQGMLPLHLALRNKPCNFRVVEELLSANPGAVFVKDRKGRTPINSGMAAMSEKDQTCRATLSTVSLFAQIITAGEKQAIVSEQTKLLTERLAAQQSQHEEEMTKLAEHIAQEKKRLEETLSTERQVWQESLETTRNDLTDERNRNEILTAQLEANATPEGFSERELELRTKNQQLKILCQRLLDQQKSLSSQMEQLVWDQQEAHSNRQRLLQEYTISGVVSDKATRSALETWQQSLDSTHSSTSESLSRLLMKEIKPVESSVSEGSADNPLQVETSLQSRSESFYADIKDSSKEDFEVSDEKKSVTDVEQLVDRISLTRSAESRDYPDWS